MSSRGGYALLSVLTGLLVSLVVLLVGPIGVLALIVALALPWLFREPFRLFLALVVTWPIATLYVGISAPSGIPDLRYERVLILVLVVLAVLRRLTSDLRLPGLAPVVVLLVAVQILIHTPGVLSAGVVAPDPVNLVNTTLVPLGMYWLAKVFVTSTAQLRWLLAGVVAAGVLVAATGFYERAIDAVESPFPVNTGTASGDRYLGVPGGRAAGVLGNPAVFGAVVGMGVLAAMARFVHATGRLSRAVFGAATLLLAYAVFVSFTRSAWLAAFVAAVLAPVFMPALRRGTARLVVIGLVVASITIPIVVDELAANPVLQERILEGQNVAGRFDRAAYSLDRFAERPVFGWGSGALDELIQRDFSSGGDGFASSHNMYLTLMVDGGVLALASFGFVVVFWGRMAVRARRRHGRQTLEASTVGVLVGVGLIYLISALFLELRFFPYLNALFWVAGAVLENLASEEYTAQADETPAPPPVRVPATGSTA